MNVVDNTIYMGVAKCPCTLGCSKACTLNNGVSSRMAYFTELNCLCMLLRDHAKLQNWYKLNERTAQRKALLSEALWICRHSFDTLASLAKDMDVPTECPAAFAQCLTNITETLILGNGASQIDTLKALLDYWRRKYGDAIPTWKQNYKAFVKSGLYDILREM